MDGVSAVLTDQCMFGLRDPQNRKLYRKATRFLTNSRYATILERKCDGNHNHQVIEGHCKLGGVWVNRSVFAQVYPRDLVRALVKLVRLEKERGFMEVFTIGNGSVAC